MTKSWAGWQPSSFTSDRGSQMGRGKQGKGGSGSVVLSIWNEEDKSSSHEITAGVLINDKLIA